MVRRRELPDISPGALGSAATDGTLETLFRDALIALDDDAIGLFKASVADAHRAGMIDLAATATGTPGPVDHFAGTVYGAAIEALELDATTVIGMANAIMVRSRDGTVPYFMFDAVAGWAARDERRVTAMLRAMGDGDAPASLRIATLQAGLRVDRARYLALVATMLVTGDAAEANAAGFVLGTVSTAGKTELLIVSNAISAALSAGDPERRVSAFEAALTIGLREGGDPAGAEAALDAVTDQVDARLRRIAATRMFMTRDAIPDGLRRRLLTLLRGVEKGETETIEAVNMAIAQRLRGVEGEPYRDLLKHILASGIADIEVMDDSAHQILTSNDGSLEAVVEDWIADGSDRLIDAARDITSIPASKKEMTLELDFSRFELSAEQTLASARKVVSSLMIQPVTATSIILSLMRTGQADAGDGLEALLFNPLLISYWEGPKEYLESASPSQPSLVQERISRLLSSLADYEGAVRSTGVILELGPTARQSFLRQLYRAEAQRKVREDMPKRSGIMDFIPITRVLHGDSVVSEVFTGDGPPQRQEFRMGSVSHSIPLARLDAIDPVGFWYQRIVLSMGKVP
ncbi:hypothetical protein [Novosphingobium sp. MMS21-SN21R]|uniref:hypothetical protein n=1 Tax=Novosphingobium sp. MMS21-SN21R TaxID=2969298 RepID=UPI002886C63E|nr:hypothetical protein [Novosphingobium sp. MMS21-SN21R]MDT0507163.1 hypothetical protein [Novosphingobium sp. MMS21-SN21R]